MKLFYRSLPLIAGMLLQSQVSAQAASPEVMALPPAAQKLQKGYLAAVEAAEAPLRDRYVEELSRLYDQAMKADKLDEALALKNEMNTTMAQPMLGKWNDTAGKGVMDLHGDGTVSNTNGQKGRWKLEGETLCILWNNGYRIECPLAKPGNKLRGQLVEPYGKTRALVEERP